MALSGLVSGFDWKGIVDQLIEVSRAPQNRMRREKTELAQRTTALNEVRSAVSTLKSSVTAMGTESALLKKAATMADPNSTWKAAATANATKGEFNFQIKQTATASVVRGRSGIGNASAGSLATTPLASTPLGRTLTSGTFTVNGRTVTIDTSTDTLNTVASKINAATSGMGFTAGYSGGKFSISSPSVTPPITLGSGADTSNFIQAMDLVNMASFGENRTGSRTLASFGLTSASDPLSSVPITDGFIKLNGTEIYVDVASGDRISDLVNRINLSSYAPGSEVTATVVGDSIVLDAPNSPTGIIIGEPTVGGPTDGYSDFFHVLGLTKDVSEDYQAITSGDRATINSSATPNRYATATSLGRVSLTAPLTAANLDSAPASGTGSFYVNGAEITYDTAVDTIQDIMERITESSAQVLASYDLVNDAIVLTNKTTGNIGTFVTTGDPSVVGSMTDTRNVVAALFGNVSMGASSLNTVTAGRDAVFSVNNGGDLTSRSNAFDETTHGIRGLTVDATAQSALTASYDVATNTWTNASSVTQKVTVAGDPSAAKDAVNKFVTDYNALQATIEKYTKVTNVDGKVTAAILAGSRELSDISRTLRQELYRNLGFSGSVQRLSDLGVTSSGIENVISLSNAALLESKINTDPDDVMDYFTNASTGLINRLGAFLGDSSTDVSAASGKLGIQLTTIQKQNTSLDKQIAEFERRLESQRQLLESSFIAMERAQAQYQQQGSYLQRTFGGGSK